MAHTLADAERRARIAAGAEGALMQALDRDLVVGRFGQDGDGQVGHAARAIASAGEASIRSPSECGQRSSHPLRAKAWMPGTRA